MIAKFLKAVACVAALTLSITVFAQVTLLDLTLGHAPASGLTRPYGGWTEPVQLGDAQRFWDRSNSSLAGIAYDFSPPLSISGYNLLSLTARRNGDHDGLTLKVILNGTNDFFATAIFDLAAFDTEAFTTQTVAWTASDSQFDPAKIWGLELTGGVLNGRDFLYLDIQRVEATRLTPVPEPSTYAAAGAGGLLLLAAFRRRRRQA